MLAKGREVDVKECEKEVQLEIESLCNCILSILASFSFFHNWLLKGSKNFPRFGNEFFKL